MPRQFELQLGTVTGAAKQHGLRLQRDAVLTLFEDLLGHIARLVTFVADRDKSRLLRTDPIGP